MNQTPPALVVLAGNPNVGKSTVFNALTGSNQHTGNWPGKTVESAVGVYTYKEKRYTLVDVPGCYALRASSPEEEVAQGCICCGGADVVVVAADATCLQRNLCFVLQVLEAVPRAVVCVNLMDEARKKGIEVDVPALQAALGVPVVATAARSGEGLEALQRAIAHQCGQTGKALHIPYSDALEQALTVLTPHVAKRLENSVAQGRARAVALPGLPSAPALQRLPPARWVAAALLDGDPGLCAALHRAAGEDLSHILALPLGIAQGLLQPPIECRAASPRQQQSPCATCACHSLEQLREGVRDTLASGVARQAQTLYADCVHLRKENCHARDRKLDRLLTSKATGIPAMLLLLGLVFYLTIAGANYPSEWLSQLFALGENGLTTVFTALGAPDWLYGAVVLGMYRTLSWVVSVMLPPMAIFFPLFTLLEDSGYLPRIAFNMDKFFQKARAHGKQALTMCMGFGCNACGVIGCRIIDSPRERLIAMLTNNFVPCNGRFPTLIALLSMFFVGGMALSWQPLASAGLLLALILLGVLATLLLSRLLSATLLKGLPSSFALELPPYRRPQLGKVVVRSVKDRTLFVLARAACVAAPAGLLLWLLANVQVGELSLLAHCTGFLDPFARLMGLDGVILMAFILGFPANEIVLPIILMGYLATGSLTEYTSLESLRLLLLEHGWTWVTALCTMLFSLMHFPCATTCWTIRKESGSWKWTLVAVALPTLCGVAVCMLVKAISGLFV